MHDAAYLPLADSFCQTVYWDYSAGIDMIGIFFVIVHYLEFGVDHLEAAAPVIGFDRSVQDDLLCRFEYLAEIGLIEPFCSQGSASVGNDY